MLKLFIISLTLLLSACSANPIKDAWFEPKSVTPVEFKKTLFVAIMDTPANRRIAEDTLVHELSLAKGERSYAFIDNAQLSKISKQKQDILKQGYQHAFVLRWVSSNTEIIRQASTGMSVSRGFWGRHHSALHFDSGTVQSRENVLFELSLYDLKHDKLIWTGNGVITNPETMNDTVKQLCSAVIEQWQQVGIIPPLT